MAERRLELARVVSVIAATVIALACGTNYAYSAWAPQFAIKLNLSSTEINLIGTAGNLGIFFEWRRLDERPQDAEETSSLLSESSTATSNDIGLMGDGRYKHQEHARIDLRGLAMLPRVEFWQLFSLLGLLTGIGLMTINNIGNNAQALWSYYDKDIPARFIRKRQFLLVCVISLTNFLGRLASGVGSDFLQKRLGRSRYWCLVTSSTIFAAAQLCAIRIENPHLLLTVAVLSGLAYGTTFGVYPALVTEAFGVHGLSQNWGFMCMAGIICAHVFNLIYGSVYDHHSTRLALNHDHPPHPLFPSSVSGSGSGTGSASASASAASGSSAAGERICSQGIRCYRTAYLVTLAASLVALVVSAWGVYSDRGKMQALHQPKARKTTTTTTQKKRKKKTTTTTTKTTPTIRRGERNGESSAMMTA
ncbi:MAG: hypothetical protein M1826_006696 [Phylliscum demangeonii]|nr:MAG: hypothetical protein M1826_006696 [Phylliscum demangeonii]